MIAELRRFLGEWVVPPGYARLRQQMTFKRFLRLTPEDAALLARNAQFKNMHAGRRCFIIGNGPSVNKQDLNPLANEITIAMNWFNKHPVIDKWKPTFFCMVEAAENIKREGLSLFLDKIEAQAYFFKTDVKEIFEEHKYLDEEKVYYLKMTAGQLAYWPASKYSLDLTRTLPGVWNTTQMAIMIALYMGFSPIYLIGMDHDWLAHPSSGWAHFYQGPHDKINLDRYNYRVRIEGVRIILRGYEVLRDVAAQKGIAIYNATAGGFLDVFERVNYEEVVGR